MTFEFGSCLCCDENDVLRCDDCDDVPFNEGCPHCLDLDTPFCWEVALAGVQESPLCSGCTVINATHILARADVFPSFACEGSCTWCKDFELGSPRADGLALVVEDSTIMLRLLMCNLQGGFDEVRWTKTIADPPVNCLTEHTLEFDVTSPGLRCGPLPDQVSIIPVNCA